MDRAIDRTRADVPLTPIEVGLTAAIVAVEAEEPHILVAADPKGGIRAGLPFGPFDPLSHRTFEIGLRNWVAAQTAINVGYVAVPVFGTSLTVTAASLVRNAGATVNFIGNTSGLGVSIANRLSITSARMKQVTSRSTSKNEGFSRTRVSPEAL